MLKLLLGLTAGLALLTSDPAWAQTDPTDTPQAAMVEAFVNRAADLIEAQGKAAFREFRKKGGEWWRGDLYLFVTDLQGTVLFNAANPTREGKNWLDERDADGKQFHKDFVAAWTKVMNADRFDLSYAKYH